jgi:hypothetical protein
VKTSLQPAQAAESKVPEVSASPKPAHYSAGPAEAKPARAGKVPDTESAAEPVASEKSKPTEAAKPVLVETKKPETPTGTD